MFYRPRSKGRGRFRFIKEHSYTAPTSGSIGAINPLRYRGYYFDSETGLYYLQSRYYDPEICRFINADEFASTGQGFIGYNMFAYCNNSPVSCFDSEGTQPVQNKMLMSNDGGGTFTCNGSPKLEGSTSYHNAMADERITAAEWMAEVAENVWGHMIVVFKSTQNFSVRKICSI